MRVLRFSDLKELKGIVYSRVHVDRLERAGMFPRRLRLGPNSVAWVEDEIDAWLAEKAAERGASGEARGGATAMNDVVVARFEKNRSEEVRVAFTEFHGHDLLDLRVFVTADATGERVPTRKGLTIKPALLPELLAALHAAETEAKARGLLD